MPRVLGAGRPRYRSPALAANALHFGSDLAGSIAVLVGLLAARAGYPEGDAVAALFVAVLVLAAAATRLIRQNVDVLMDRAPAREVEAARRARSRALEPPIQLRRLRMRRAAGRHFADVVIGVPPAAAVEQGHAAANAVEEAVERAVPGADVVVHVEPREGGSGRCASVPTRRRCASPASARSTTSSCSRSATGPRSRST